MTINEQIEAGVPLITLTADTAESIVIPSWANVTLDLNGFRLTGDGVTHTVENRGVLTVRDSSEAKTGTIYCNVANKGCIFNSYGAKLTIDRAILDRGDVSWYCLLNWGESVVINYIYVNLTAPSNKAAVIANGFYSPEQDNPNKVFCSCIINGGYIATQGDPNAPVKNDEYGIMSILGGTFKARMRALNNWNDCGITGGTFESETGAPIISGSYPSDGGHCELRVTGGTFKGVGNTAVADCSEGQSNPGYVAPVWAVAGGTFTVPVPEQYCAKGFAPTLLPDGTYGVSVDMSNTWDIERSTNGVGFVGTSGTILKKDTLEYTAGGIAVPVYGFTPIVVLAVNAEGGGVSGFINNGKIVLYKNGAEVSGTLNKVTMVLLGH